MRGYSVGISRVGICTSLIIINHYTASVSTKINHSLTRSTIHHQSLIRITKTLYLSNQDLPHAAGHQATFSAGLFVVPLVAINLHIPLILPSKP